MFTYFTDWTLVTRNLYILLQILICEEFSPNSLLYIRIQITIQHFFLSLCTWLIFSILLFPITVFFSDFYVTFSIVSYIRIHLNICNNFHLKTLIVKCRFKQRKDFWNIRCLSAYLAENTDLLITDDEKTRSSRSLVLQ